MLSELKLLTLAQLEKVAIDSGPDVIGGLANSLMSFRSSQCPLKVWLGMLDAQPLVGLSKLRRFAIELEPPRHAGDNMIFPVPGIDTVFKRRKNRTRNRIKTLVVVSIA